MEISPEKTKAWIDKWDLMNEARHQYTHEQQRQIHRDNPLDIGFRPVLYVNGKMMRADRGSSMHWISPACVNGEERDQVEDKAFLEHYGLDQTRCWTIRRTAFLWATVRKPAVRSIELGLEREMTNIPGIRFQTPALGESVTFSHPLTGVEHTLTVDAFDAQQMDTSRMPNNGMEYPAHYYMMAYTLQPEIPARNLMLQDCVQSDEPRFKQMAFSNRVKIDGAAACIGIIGGSDGPTAMFVSHRDLPKLHAACSSLHFEPAQTAVWQFVFREKLLPDMAVTLR